MEHCNGSGEWGARASPSLGNTNAKMRRVESIPALHTRLGPLRSQVLCQMDPSCPTWGTERIVQMSITKAGLQIVMREKLILKVLWGQMTQAMEISISLISPYTTSTKKILNRLRYEIQRLPFKGSRQISPLANLSQKTICGGELGVLMQENTVMGEDGLTEPGPQGSRGKD